MEMYNNSKCKLNIFKKYKSVFSSISKSSITVIMDDYKGHHHSFLNILIFCSKNYEYHFHFFLLWPAVFLLISLLLRNKWLFWANKYPFLCLISQGLWQSDQIIPVVNIWENGKLFFTFGYSPVKSFAMKIFQTILILFEPLGIGESIQSHKINLKNLTAFSFLIFWTSVSFAFLLFHSGKTFTEFIPSFYISSATLTNTSIFPMFLWKMSTIFQLISNSRILIENRKLKFVWIVLTFQRHQVLEMKYSKWCFFF